MPDSKLRFGMIVCVNVFAWCMLGLYGVSTAAPEGQKQPFNNSVAQRKEMIATLKEIKGLLKEQNSLLRAEFDRKSADGKQRR